MSEGGCCGCALGAFKLGLADDPAQRKEASYAPPAKARKHYSATQRKKKKEAGFPLFPAVLRG